MVLEHIWLRIFFKIINGPGPYGPEPYGPEPYYWVKIAQKPDDRHCLTEVKKLKKKKKKKKEKKKKKK